MDGMVYRPITEGAGRLPGAPPGARWIASRQGYPEGISKLASFGTRALQDPQQVLDGLRSAGDVREQGPWPEMAGAGSATPSS